MSSDIDEEISREEILKAIKNSKNNKASGPDLITNEMIKCGMDSLINPLFMLFNSILKTGTFPEAWNCSLITPLHKSGSINDPKNYRGIAVSNTLSKLFIKILTSRLENFMSKNNLWSKFQGGFKKNVRTEDNVFILNTLITECLRNKNESLYLCFVDFSKFFDTINRNLLLYKLIKYGITGNVYRTIKSMYNSCEYAVKTCRGITSTFSSEVGVKQGCGMSPLLSNIFQNDLYQIFDDTCSPICLNNNLKMNCLSWADDLVLISKTKDGIQNCLNKLSEYCEKWHLTVNTEKTNFMVFGTSKVRTLKYNNLTISKVDSYKYLGVIIHKSGKIKYNIEERITKASRAVNMLKGALSSTGNISVDVALSLFDKQILPILTYGSTSWGISKPNDKLYISDIPENVTTVKALNEYLNCDSILSFRRLGKRLHKANRKVLVVTNSHIATLQLLNKKNLNSQPFNSDNLKLKYETFHTKFCKYVLNINKFASNTAVLTELGRYPLTIYNDLKVVKYWHRLEHIDHFEILKECFHTCKKNNHTWYRNIYDFLSCNGTKYIVDNPKNYCESALLSQLENVLKDQYRQQVEGKLKSNPELLTLSILKKNLYKQSRYLSNLKNIETRKKFTVLRTGCSKLSAHQYHSEKLNKQQISDLQRCPFL